MFLFYKMPWPADVVIHNLRHFFALLSLAGLHLLFSVTFMKHQPLRLKNEPKKKLQFLPQPLETVSKSELVPIDCSVYIISPL